VRPVRPVEAQPSQGTGYRDPLHALTGEDLVRLCLLVELEERSLSARFDAGHLSATDYAKQRAWLQHVGSIFQASVRL
jgi:hypothetical protein